VGLQGSHPDHGLGRLKGTRLHVGTGQFAAHAPGALLRFESQGFHEFRGRQEKQPAGGTASARPPALRAALAAAASAVVDLTGTR
jgi:hypothetical protein